MGSYAPHTVDEIEVMLSSLGIGSLDELFSAIPAAVRLAGGLDLPPGVPEPDAAAHMQALADRNRPVGRDLICFAGGGAYDHQIPPVVRALAGRSEFVTSYTPYQPEVAQGVLQAVFEFQTLISRLTGVEISNASLYDGAASLVEAVNLGVAASGRSKVWMSAGCNPSWRQVARTFAQGTGHRIETIPLRRGVTAWPDVPSDDESPGVLVIGYPNYLGCLEQIDQARTICDRVGALLVVVFDPISAGVLRSPGDWGADIVVGEGQALGTALSFGGPYLGLFACTAAHVRRLPGRLVGETVDSHGKRAYVTTLRAREQDIRREKATSNVCTNQTLMAVTAAVQLGWLGSSGIAEVAHRSAAGTHYTRQGVLAIEGVESLTDLPVLREFAVHLPSPASVVVERMADAGFLAGIALDPELAGDDHGLLISVTERRTRTEIDQFVECLQKAVR